MLKEIFNSIRELYACVDPLLELVQNVTKLCVDGRQTGTASVACGMSCLENAGLAPTSLRG
jgi:hypothetical protein